MTLAITGDRLLARAFLASLVLHVLVLALIPPLVASEGSQTVETLAFVKIIRVTVAHPTPHPAAAEPARAPAFAPHPRAAPVQHAASVKRAERRKLVKSASPLPRAPVVAAVVRSGDAPSAVHAEVSVATASAQPEAPVDQSRPNHEQVGGMLPLGVDEPTPVLEPSVHQALLALGVHVTLTITVDEHGHTKSVAFAPPLDAAVEDRIRSMLASASWDPAVCGAGTTCEANATIKL